MPMVISDMPVKRKLQRSLESLNCVGYLVLYLYNKLVYEVNLFDLNRTMRIIEGDTEKAYSLDVSLPVQVKIGTVWSDLTEYNFFFESRCILTLNINQLYFFITQFLNYTYLFVII